MYFCPRGFQVSKACPSSCRRQMVPPSGLKPRSGLREKRQITSTTGEFLGFYKTPPVLSISLDFPKFKMPELLQI